MIMIMIMIIIIIIGFLTTQLQKRAGYQAPGGPDFSPLRHAHVSASAPFEVSLKALAFPAVSM